jgi:hypothetical protein
MCLIRCITMRITIVSSILQDLFYLSSQILPYFNANKTIRQMLLPNEHREIPWK